MDPYRIEYWVQNSNLLFWGPRQIHTVPNSRLQDSVMLHQFLLQVSLIIRCQCLGKHNSKRSEAGIDKPRKAQSSHSMQLNGLNMRME